MAWLLKTDPESVLVMVQNRPEAKEADLQAVQKMENINRKQWQSDCFSALNLIHRCCVLCFCVCACVCVCCISYMGIGGHQ